MENPNRISTTSVLEQVQHHHVTHCMESLLPPTVKAHKLKQVLDINCHAGAWAVALAQAYPHVTVTGVDNDTQAIALARHKTVMARLSRARFYEANLHKPLPLQDEAFDLVHVFSSQPLFYPHEWPNFLQECKRVLKPGGAINLVNITLGPGSSPAYQRFRLLIDQLLQAAGYGFTATSATSASGVYFVRMLNAAGFCESKYLIRPLSLGGWKNTGGRACYQLALQHISMAKASFIQHNLISSDEFDALLAQQEKDILEPEFCAMAALISAFAIKR